MAGFAERISKLSAIYRLLISIGIAVVVGLALGGRTQLATQVSATWDAFACSSLGLIWVIIPTTPHRMIRERVKRQDVAGPAITIFVICAACAALLSVVLLLHGNKGSAQPHFVAHVVLTLLAVMSSWALVHTVFGLHYAHTFYGDADGKGPKETAGGLDFPSEKNPDYLDFAYFSFVIGMTFQVSDVQVTSRNLRQLVLLHGVLSFAFNTVILALTINTVTSLI